MRFPVEIVRGFGAKRVHDGGGGSPYSVRLPFTDNVDLARSQNRIIESEAMQCNRVPRAKDHAGIVKDSQTLL